MHLGCESLSIFQLNRTTDKNGWMPIQKVSNSPMFEQNSWRKCINIDPASELLFSVWSDWPLIRTGEHPSRQWVSLQQLSRSDPLTRAGEHPSRMWVVLQCLSRSEPLTRMGEHPSSLWVTSPGLEQIRATDQERVTTHPASESLSRAWADQSHWQVCVNTHPDSESLSSAWADQSHWREWVNTYSGCESLSSDRVDQNY